MGVSPSKNCSTNYSSLAPAPNPDPKRWRLLKWVSFKNAYVLKVRYLDCTNFEGEKIMVYAGKFNQPVFEELDPHFQEKGHSPIARFRPDWEGWKNAQRFAKTL